MSARIRRSATLLCTAAMLGLAPAACAATRHVSPTGSDSGDCVGSACASLKYAYERAVEGDEIQVGPGEYPIQYVPAGSKAVIVRGMPGNKLRQLDNSAANVIFDGIDVDAGGTQTNNSAVFENHGVDNVTFRNGRIGNVTDQKGVVVSGSKFTFDNVFFHDAVLRSSTVHMECVFAIVVPGFAVRNSTFHNCAIMDLFFVYGEWWDPKPPSYGNITIENNVFEHVLNDDSSWNYYPLYIGQTGDNVLDGWVVRNNTFEQSASLGTSHDRAINSRWVGNVGGWDCIAGMVYSHNVGKKCSATDKPVAPNQNSRTSIAPFGWVDPANLDFRLKAGSPAVGAGDPNDAPRTDRNGYVRDARPDAGAHEFGAGPSSSAPPPITSPRPGRWSIRHATLRPRTVCRTPRRRCPASTKLRLQLGRPARVTVRVQRLRRGHKPTRAGTLTRKRVKLHKAMRIGSKRLRPGRYRVIVSAVDATGARSSTKVLELRVR